MKDNRFSFSQLEEMKEFVKQNKLLVFFSDNVQLLFQRVFFNGLCAPNALAVLPMEGCDATSSGSPSELTFRRYRRFGAGGSGIIWFEATAVVPQGKANPRHLYIHHDNINMFRSLVTEVRHAAINSMGDIHRPLCILQLTHAGRYSKPEGKAAPVFAARNPLLDKLSGIGNNHKPVSDDYLDKLQDSYVEAARLAREAGFDGVDIKACHYYLISELLSAHTRPGKYGGTLENRARFLLETVDKVNALATNEFIITVRLNIFDGIPYPYGFGVDRENHKLFDLTDLMWLVKQLNQRGVRILNTSAGNPYYNAYLGRPYNKPLIGEQMPKEHPIYGVARLFKMTEAVQKEFPEIAVVGCGYSWLRQYFGYAAAANVIDGRVKIVGAGRMSFAYPDYAKDLMLNGMLDPKKCCTCCSMCTQIMRDGGRAGCVIKDKEVYGQIYREGRIKVGQD